MELINLLEILELVCHHKQAKRTIFIKIESIKYISMLIQIFFFKLSYTFEL